MIEPARGKVELDLGDGKPLLVLWYPNGAIKMLESKLEVELPPTRAHELVTRLNSAKALGLYVWSGILWSDRSADYDAIVERVDWGAKIERAQILRAVTRAIYYALMGTFPDDMKPEEKAGEAETDPPLPTAAPGPGTMLNGSPSVNSDTP